MAVQKLKLLGYSTVEKEEVHKQRMAVDGSKKLLRVESAGGRTDKPAIDRQTILTHEVYESPRVDRTSFSLISSYDNLDKRYFNVTFVGPSSFTTGTSFDFTPVDYWTYLLGETSCIIDAFIK